MKKLIAALIFAAAFATLFTGCSCADGTVSDNDVGETSSNARTASERMIDDTMDGYNRETTTTSYNSVVGNTDTHNRM